MVVLINYYTNLYNSSSANIIRPHPLFCSFFSDLVLRELMKRPMWKICFSLYPFLLTSCMSGSAIGVLSFTLVLGQSLLNTDCPRSIRDDQQHQRKMQQGLERSRRQSEWTCVGKLSEPNLLWMNKREDSLQVATQWEIKEMKKISPCLLFSSLFWCVVFSIPSWLHPCFSQVLFSAWVGNIP